MSGRPLPLRVAAEHQTLTVVHAEQDAASGACSEQPRWPLLICLLGPFRLLQGPRRMPIRGESKAAVLLGSLALRSGRPVARETLLDLLWPQGDADLASQSLHSLVHEINKRLRASLGDAAVVHADGHYRLHVEAGIGVDVDQFDTLVQLGRVQENQGHQGAAAAHYEQALRLYRGDLCVSSDIYASVERERLRGLYLTLLACLAGQAYDRGDYAMALQHAQRLLTHDPCREDAYRLAMRCYVRRGERVQALRHYQLCVGALHAEFDAQPEPATTALRDQIVRDPASL